MKVEKLKNNNENNNSVKICLNMIVKNEAKIIERCFTALKPIIDYIVVTDTGSTDNTVEIMNNYLKNNNIDGEIYNEPWKNFGYNRTNSIENAKKFFTKKNINMENIFVLLVDADMIIEIMTDPVTLKSTLAQNEFDHYLIEQYNPVISYHNTRLIRLSKNITCRGVTHEYYDVDNAKTSTFNGIRINDIGDGGSKTNKFERDVKLLLDGIDEEPKNERYHFYLAESYKNSGKLDEAIYFYKKRIEFGGWYEEVYMAHYNVGQLYEERKDWKNALYHYTEGWIISKYERGEVLFRMINYYKNNRQYKMAFLYLCELVKLKYPSEQYLFIDYNIHGYKKYELLTLISYYVGRLDLGLYSSDLLLIMKKYNIDNGINEMIHKNLKFYIPKLKHAKIENINGFKNLNKYANSSSSLFYNNIEKVYDGIIRTVNYSMNDRMVYTINTEDKNYIDTQNFIVKIDAKNNTIISQELIKTELVPKHLNGHIRGFEDARYFVFNNKKYLISTSLEFGEKNHPSIVICELNDMDIVRVVDQKYNNNICQKNWAPIFYNGAQCFIYSYNPFIVLRMNEETLETEEIIKRDVLNYNLGRFRGSSNYVVVSNTLTKELYYLGIIHEVITNEPRSYIHRFVKLDGNLNVIDVSSPFYFEEFFVEFVLSLHYNNDENVLIIPFSVRDNKTMLCKLNIDNIEWYGSNLEERIKHITF